MDTMKIGFDSFLRDNGVSDLKTAIGERSSNTILFYWMVKQKQND